MTFRGDHRYRVEDLAVNVTLVGKPFKGVKSALNFVSVYVSVDYRNIDPRHALKQAKFIYDAGVGILAMHPT